MDREYKESDRRSRTLHSYQHSVPAGTTPADEMRYHLNRLVEFTWNMHAYARHVGSSHQERDSIVGIETDLFYAIEACVSCLDKTFVLIPGICVDPEPFECWIAFARVITTLPYAKCTITATQGTRVYLFLFVTSKLLKQIFTSRLVGQVEEKLRESDFFGRQFQLTTNEKAAFAELLPDFMSPKTTLRDQIRMAHDSLRKILAEIGKK